ncbi:MAG: DotI/IcmL family type IV secretion protein [Micavibrio sp.]|nr:DotI/IcmL family type IV secretion protein [Micavibrio sp.]
MIKTKWILVALAVFGMVGSSTAAHAGLFEFFFPSLGKKESNIYQTLRAPFAEAPPPEKPITVQEALSAKLPENESPLEFPHRQPAQLAEIMAILTSQILAFTDVEYQKELEEHQKFFDQGAKTLYAEFLEKRNIPNIMKSGHYTIRSFVEETPIILNSQVLEGRYRWVLDVPVTISYLPRDLDYKKGADATNQRFTVRLQVGRVKDSGNDHGILIETWEIKPATPLKNQDKG